MKSKKEVKAGWIGRLCRGKARKSPKRKSKHEKTENLKLTLEQQMAFDEISEKMDQEQYERFLIYGVTGSGKTEIYLTDTECNFISVAQKVLSEKEIKINKC